jgi:malate permease and related proteins
MNLLSVVVPIFGLIFIGWLLMRIGLFPQWLVKMLNNYVYYVGVTVITFLSLHDTSLSLLLDPTIYLLTLLPIAAIILVAFAAARLMKLENIAIPVFVTCAFFGNTAYVGFPLNISVQGQDSLALTAFVSTIYTVVVFTFGVFLCQRYSATKKNGLQLHRIPVFWAAAAGLLLSAVAIPDIARTPLDFIEATTSPLALLATGALISAAGIRENVKVIGAISFIKLLLMPALVLLAAMAAGVSGAVYKTSLLEAATPVGVTNTVLAKQFDLDEGLASSAVVVTTALFFATLILVLLFI